MKFSYYYEIYALKHGALVMFSLSKRERNLWIECSVDVLVLIYYLPKALKIAMGGDSALVGRAMGDLIGETIVVAIMLTILALIISTIVFANSDNDDVRDERDKYFELKSFRSGYYALIVFVCILIGQVVLQELLPFDLGPLPLTDSPLAIAHWLFLSVGFASLFQCSLQLFYYRRGY